ncbi:MAG: hypothetical protein PHO28_03940 [Candidatus Pacebacteria bacterium]|nr:hypothetical protein [Candidatus Paceibacterota bacterium]
MAIYTKIQLTAWDLATELQDKKHLGFYLKLAKKYPESLLREVLAIVKQTGRFYNIDNKGAYYTRIFFNKVKGVY